MSYQFKKINSPIRNTAIWVNSKNHLDLYHTILGFSWFKFNAFFVFIFIAINCLFGLLYWLDPKCIGGVFNHLYIDYFFFSVQTLATIGYGGMYPQTLYGHILVTAEAMVGLLSLGLFAAVAFSRLSLPRSLIAFSDKAVVSIINGTPTLMIRLANNRSNSVIDAQISLSLFKQEMTAEGMRMMRIHDLKLARSSTPMLLLTWLVMHPINEQSPLYGLSALEAIQTELTIIATVTGLDETLSQTIHAKTTYQSSDIHWNSKFKDLFKIDNKTNKEFIDLSQLNSIEKI